MYLSDLKVEMASVMVSNAKDENREYKISANFITREGKITNIEGGSVVKIETNKEVANFYSNMEYNNSLSLTFKEDAYGNDELQCTLNRYINEFITIATNKALSEAEE